MKNVSLLKFEYYYKDCLYATNYNLSLNIKKETMTSIVKLKAQDPNTDKLFVFQSCSSNCNISWLVKQCFTLSTISNKTHTILF